MSKGIVPSALLEFLQNVREPADLCDADGRAFGHFTPENLVSRKYNEPPPLTPEERERIMSEPSYTPEEVWDYLEKLK